MRTVFRYGRASLLTGRLTVAGSLALVVWQALVGPIPAPVQGGLFAALLLSAGIPHGALDHLVERALAEEQGRPFRFGRFLRNYLLLMGLFGAVWFIVPSIGLLVFLLSAVWHFGETDIEGAPAVFGWVLTRCAAGTFVLVCLLLPHAAEVTPILDRITHHQGPTMRIWQWAQHWMWPLGLSTGAVTLLLFMNASARWPIPVNGHRLIRLALVLVLGAQLPLVLAFGLYFGGWHALSSFREIGAYLSRAHHKSVTVAHIWLQALPFTALAVGFLSLLGWGWYYYALQWDPLPVLFIFLSLITLPHLRVMHTMSRQSAPQTDVAATRTAAKPMVGLPVLRALLHRHHPENTGT